MKFMLMMNTPRGTGDYQISSWTPEAFNAHIRFMKDLNRDLTKSGEFVEAQGLTPPGHWTTVGGDSYLSNNSSFSSGPVTHAPGTQTTMDFAPACLANDGVTVIANTACVIFNSRGVPIDGTGAPTALDAVYLTDGRAVNAVTVSATGMTRVWAGQPVATPAWVLQ